MIGAFAFLMFHTSRNRLLSQLRRVRSPRYALALLLGVGYFWLVFFGRSARSGGDATVQTASVFEAFLPFGLLLTAAYTWLFGADRSALAFSEAEVSMLFTAPVSRRGLILYKLVRSQTAVLTTSLIWTLLFNHAHSGLTHAVGYWVMLSTVSLHRLGAALVRAAAAEHGAHGLRRNWRPASVFVLVAATFIVCLLKARAQFAAISSPGEIGGVLSQVFDSAPLSWVMYPFRVAVAPAFTARGTAWSHAIVPALVLLALHFWWVLRSQTAFEEAAAAASAEQARRLEAIRARRGAGGDVRIKAGGRSLRLAPTGPPAIALIWKNYLWLARTEQLRSMVGLPLLALIGALVFAGRSVLAEFLIIILCAVTVLVIFVFGPMTMRNDLRAELRRLPLLKTLPLPAHQIVLAEVASSASPTAAMQYLMLMVGLLAMMFVDKSPLSATVRIALCLAAPVLLAGISLANFTVHNALALLFPGWVRLGDAGAVGIEAMGQVVLTVLITLAALLVLMILPAGAGGVLYAVLYTVLGTAPIVALTSAGMAVGVVLIVESYLLMVLLGGVLERTEPMHVQ